MVRSRSAKARLAGLCPEFGAWIRSKKNQGWRNISFGNILPTLIQFIVVALLLLLSVAPLRLSTPVVRLSIPDILSLTGLNQTAISALLAFPDARLGRIYGEITSINRRFCHRFRFRTPCLAFLDRPECIHGVSKAPYQSQGDAFPDSYFKQRSCQL